MQHRRGLFLRAVTNPRRDPSHHPRRRDNLRQLPAAERDKSLTHFRMLRKRVGWSGRYQGRRQRHDAGGNFEETGPSIHLFAVIGGVTSSSATLNTYQVATQAHAMY